MIMGLSSFLLLVACALSLRRNNESNVVGLSGSHGPGILWHHAIALQAWASKTDSVVILRQSEQASLEKIQKGYATKSVDIKDKSSNWGPMNGLVPLDPFFSKTRESDNSISYALKHGKCVPTAKLIPQISGPRKAIKDVKACQINMALEKDGDAESPTQIDVVKVDCEKDKEYDGILFACHKGKVMWDYEGEHDYLWVWAYNGVPVTGDYDLWAIAPRKNSQLLKSGPRDAYVMTQSSVLGGVATMPPFMTKLIQAGTLNNELKNEQSVFNHGAELQNYYFVQAIDKKLTVILPDSLLETSLFKSLENEFTVRNHDNSEMKGVWEVPTNREDYIFNQMIGNMLNSGYLMPPHPVYYSTSEKDLQLYQNVVTGECGGNKKVMTSLCLDALKDLEKVEGFLTSGMSEHFMAANVEEFYRQYLQEYVAPLVKCVQGAHYIASEIKECEESHEDLVDGLITLLP